jgi:hypothetical protein
MPISTPSGTLRKADEKPSSENKRIHFQAQSKPWMGTGKVSKPFWGNLGGFDPPLDTGSGAKNGSRALWTFEISRSLATV